MFFSLFLKLALVFGQRLSEQYLPIVIWHGMGDSGASEGMDRLARNMTDWYPGLLVHPIVIGEDEGADKKAGFFDRIDRQVEEVCSALKKVPALRKGFNAIGFSQGGLFLRAYIQKCNDPLVESLMTFGSPHSGTDDIPNCQQNPSSSCSLMRSIVKSGVYWDWIQNTIVQAQYFRMHQNLASYYSKNIFLPDLNQEGPLYKYRPDYTQRLSTLKNLILVRFINDTMITPRDSAWFSAYDKNGKLLDIHDQDWFKKDALGLLTMERAGKIHYLSLPGAHMEIALKDLKSLVDEYFMSSKGLLQVQ